MTPQDFISRWRGVELKERSASQTHFNDLCALLGLPDPIAADPKGDWFSFEKGATKTTGGEGWADVWRKDCFAWEYKGRRKDLTAAYVQLQQYAVALDNPPLLIVSDMERIRIHTNWTNTVQQVHDITLDDLLDAGRRDLLRACFDNPERLRPQKTRQTLTEEAAENFAAIADRLRSRGHDSQTVAHFVNRLVFCMFAEDVGLLPDAYFSGMIDRCTGRNAHLFAQHASTLFAAMRGGGHVGFDRIEWFNGGLFDTDEALDLTYQDIDDLRRAAYLDWSDIDPSILGTLFERGLDPDKRSQLGAHYTDRDKIMMIVRPVIIAPLMAEWDEVKAAITTTLAAAPAATVDRLLSPADKAARSRALAAAETLHAGFLERLRAFRVLDPACGSGNFLYLALLALRDIEHRANLDAEALGLPRPGLPAVGPENLLGIEINPYAAELARVSVWIGDIQWSRRNGFEPARNPILRPLSTIECRDAVLAPDGTRADWPRADVVVGNPPFKGSQKMNRELGREYVSALRNAWTETLPATSDFVTYWFANAFLSLTEGNAVRVGLVATNSIREQSNRAIMDCFVERGMIYYAWSDEPWVVDGADVRVSLVCFARNESTTPTLDGRPVSKIYANLSANNDGFDITKAVKLIENQSICNRGIEIGGPFEISQGVFENLVAQPTNPNGLRNDVVLRRMESADGWKARLPPQFMIDFAGYESLQEAVLFEAPFATLEKAYSTYGTKGKRLVVKRENWWKHRRSGESLRKSIVGLKRYLVTPRVAKHRTFSWFESSLLPDSRIFAFGRDDDTTFGILQSRIHEVWSLATCSWHGVGNDPTYNAQSCFETFPFPEGLTPDIPASAYAGDPRAQSIAAAAARLNELRENWLNPPDLVMRVPEVVPGYPDRILPKDDKAAAVLKTRTLTTLYNARPAWLDHAHRALDQAVAEAYGWGDDWRAGRLSDDDILARLFRLNQDRAAAGR